MEYLKNDLFINKEGKRIYRQRCQIFSRTMGYIRNFGSMNDGKKSEHYSRKYFIDTSLTSEDLRKRENANFINKYGKI